MKNAPKPSTLKSAILATIILFALTGCQNMRPVVGYEQKTEPLTAPTAFSTDHSFTNLYNEFSWQWYQFSNWMSSGMMQPTRTNFTN